MKDVIDWRKKENFHKENFYCIVREVASQAKKIQTEQRTVPLFAQSNIRNDNYKERTIHRTSRVVRVTKTRQVQRELAVAAQRQLGKRHYLSECEMSDKKNLATHC